MEMPKENFLYHGSPVSGLKVLRPEVSEHGKPYVYLSADMAAAALYAVRPVESPYNWYPYGFDWDRTLVYTEYYADALADIYREKTGFLYRCSGAGISENPTGIPGVYVSQAPVTVLEEQEIPDMLVWLLEQEKRGHLRIRRYSDLTREAKEQLEEMIAREITVNRLYEHPEISYSRFLAEKFSEVWKRTA